MAEDHVVMRMGLVAAINGESDMCVVAEAGDGIEAIQAYREERPDIVLMDLRMPQQGGIETIRLLRDEFKEVRVIVYSSFSSGEEIYASLKAGASGYVVKDMPLEQLMKAIRTVYQGEHFIPPEISARIGFRVASNLSPREMEVLKLVAKGMSNKEIGAALHLVEGTVKVHLTNILAKLGVSDRTQAVLSAVKRGIIEIE